MSFFFKKKILVHGYYRYVCPSCLKTFLDEGKHLDWVCCKCNEVLVPVGIENCANKNK